MRMKYFVIAAAFALTNISVSVAADADAKIKAKTVCAGCHGPNGISTNPLWPNLAGQKDQYLIKAMKEYRDGARPDPNMAALAQGLTDDEIASLAAFYAALPAGG